MLGPSGCGKSTLLRAVAGLERPDHGTVTVDDEDVTRRPAYRRGFALMFQDGQLFGHLSVADNVAYPLRPRPRHGADRRRRAARVASSSSWSGCPASESVTPRPSPAASANGWRWPAPWR